MLGEIWLSSGFQLSSGVTAVQTVLREKDNPGCWRLLHVLLFRGARRLASPALFPLVLSGIISAEESGGFCLELLLVNFFKERRVGRSKVAPRSLAIDNQGGEQARLMGLSFRPLDTRRSNRYLEDFRVRT